MSSIHAQTARVENSPVLTHRQPYLNTPFFIVRGIIKAPHLGRAGVLSVRGFRRTAEQAGHHPRLPTQSALGLVLYFLTMTFAAVDWVMSLSEHWFSTISTYLIIGQILMTGCSSSSKPCIRRDGSFHWDASYSPIWGIFSSFVVAHAYMAFSQFFIIWNGNKPHEVLWYIERTRGLEMDCHRHHHCPFCSTVLRAAVPANQAQSLLLGSRRYCCSCVSWRMHGS